MAKKSEQREQTMRTLIEIAREQFAAKGYANVALEDIVAAAGVTRGALYHHFDGKEGLFRAVLETVSREVGAFVQAKADAQTDDWNVFTTGCRAFLEIALDPQYARILLIDAPAVLGWATWRAIDEENSMRLLRDQLSTLAAQGLIQTPSIEALTHLLSGAMNELALWVAEAEHPQDTLQKALAALDAMLTQLYR